LNVGGNSKCRSAKSIGKTALFPGTVCYGAEFLIQKKSWENSTGMDWLHLSSWTWLQFDLLNFEKRLARYDGEDYEISVVGIYIK